LNFDFVEIEDLDNRISNIESGEHLVKYNEPEPVDMQEVNELMNDMSEFYDESEETSDLIEENMRTKLFGQTLHKLHLFHL
jgi:t-SNARE complex subunit (syntaxin)